jgi:hypothetical protein
MHTLTHVKCRYAAQICFRIHANKRRAGKAEMNLVSKKDYRVTSKP